MRDLAGRHEKVPYDDVFFFPAKVGSLMQPRNDSLLPSQFSGHSRKEVRVYRESIDLARFRSARRDWPEPRFDGVSGADMGRFYGESEVKNGARREREDWFELGLCVECSIHHPSNSTGLSPLFFLFVLFSKPPRAPLLRRAG